VATARRSRRAWPSIVVVAALLAGAAAPARADLAATVDRIVRTGGLPRATSVSIRTAAGTVVYERHARRPVTPASNAKLLTLAATLDALGPSFRFETRAVAASPPAGGTVLGPLYVVGGGDPTLSTAAYARRARLRSVPTMESLARAVRAAGVTRVTGDVVADAGVFDRQRGVGAWRRGFAGDECAPLSGLTVDRNRVAGRPVWRPEQRAAETFRAALVRAGVRVTGVARAGTAPSVAPSLAQVTSPPLAHIVRRVGKDSDNFTAEVLLKALGASAGDTGSTAGGARTLRSVLAARKLDLAPLRVADGSGLASTNRLSADLVTALLVDVEADAEIADVFRTALARAGLDGTLERRLRRGPAFRRVYAKTGTLRHVSALSGYAGSHAFSVVMNHPRLPLREARRVQDAIAQAVAGAASVPAPPVARP
jgi:D-alanyl-D-alanine carboxypeptidase/D-alanyl-D-alanine-endopeptidase (penicillin-binding protein 4)